MITENRATPIERPYSIAGLRARDIFPACLAFGVSFSVYLFSLAPTITFGDSGEVITAAITLGIAHPPGYPLWLILAKLFSFLPIGTVAYRLNLMSAILDAAAIGLLALVISRTFPRVCARVISRDAFESPVAAMITGSASATAALIIAFSPVFWRQSVVTEVYPLHHLLVCLILLVLERWGEAPEKHGLLFAMAFLVGAGMGNHHTLLLMTPAIGLYVLLVRPRVLLSPKIMLGCFALLFLGLCLYLYLPLRASAHPPLNWGNPATWEAFWFHVGRKQYRVIEVVRPLSVLMPQLKFFFASIADESLPVVLLLPALLGIGFADRQGKIWLLFTFASFVFTGVVFILIANTELDLNAQEILRIYFLASFLIVAIWIGYGIGIIGLLALRASRRLRLKVMPATIIALLWFLLPVSNLMLNYSKASMRGKNYARVYGEMLINGLRQGAIVFVGTDSAYSIPMYLKWVENRRPDISILNLNRLVLPHYAAEARRNAPDIAFLTTDDYIEASSQATGVSQPGGSVYGRHKIMRMNGYLAWKLLQRNISERPIYYDEGMPIDWVRDFAIPSGLLMELKADRIESLPAELVASDSDYWNTLERKLLGDENFLADAEARQKFSKCRSNIGALYLHHKMYAEAETALNQATRLSELNLEAYAWLAIMHKEQGRQEEALRIFEDYLKRDPWNTSARSFADWLRQE